MDDSAWEYACLQYSWKGGEHHSLILHPDGSVQEERLPPLKAMNSLGATGFEMTGVTESVDNISVYQQFWFKRRTRS